MVVLATRIKLNTVFSPHGGTMSEVYNHVDLEVTISEEEWDEFEAAVITAARRFGEVTIIEKNVGYVHLSGDKCLFRMGLIMQALRKEMIKD